MFTGIVETATEILSCAGGKLVLANPLPPEELHVGQSICVSGCCLTIVDFDSAKIVFDVSPETLERTKFGRTRAGGLVNLERSLRMSGSLDGHIVTGHIDTTGTVRSIETLDLDSTRYWFDVERLYDRWLVEKGSIALDGVSLTVNNVDANGFNVVIIPHTRKITAFRALQAGDTVNLEFDLLAKYVEKLMSQRAQNKERAAI